MVLKPRVKVASRNFRSYKNNRMKFMGTWGALISNGVLSVSSLQVLTPRYPAYFLFYPIRFLHVQHTSDVRIVGSSLSNLKV